MLTNYNETILSLTGMQVRRVFGVICYCTLVQHNNRFGHWLTLCTLNIHLLIYLLTVYVYNRARVPALSVVQASSARGIHIVGNIAVFRAASPALPTAAAAAVAVPSACDHKFLGTSSDYTQ